jgi:hypothetical protein
MAVKTPQSLQVYGRLRDRPPRLRRYASFRRITAVRFPKDRRNTRGTESLQTLHWREMDSNHRFPVRIKRKGGAGRRRSGYPAHGRQQDALAERGIRTLLPR